MIIGVSSTVFSENNLEESLESVSKEFSHWEIFSEAEHDLNKVYRRLLAVKDSYSGMTFSVHSPISETNLAGLSERMREASVLEIIATMERMAELDMNTLTVHPGTASFSIKNQEDKALLQAKKSMRTLDRASAEFGITVAVENMPSLSFMLGREASQLQEIITDTDLGVCFDIGHANTTGQMDSMIELLGRRIVNVHIHDNNGDRDSHMTIGEGSIDFHSVLSKLRGYSGRYIIESKGLESAVVSKSRLELLTGL
ncbi:MAG: sugar phosphate isomerase/epimerase family protein [Candidatus Methanomethylophilaceae archaeon]|jgi:sugar phosphate isomerase/epimerase|nr:sugar phosphate isomerase/epimerase family protein [Candidatus Methanomethylophilaceae archaeon]NLF33358.1 sugar phosphate isomerase/epimerase [Thermoplasmatales archaeon]